MQMIQTIGGRIDSESLFDRKKGRETMGFMDEVSAFTKGVGQKAKGNYDVVAMNTKISGLQKEMQNLYLKTGQQYFSLYKENPAENMRESVEAICRVQEQIAEIRQQIETTKAETAAVPLKAGTFVPDGNGENGFCPSCGAPLTADSLFCVNCGAKIE